MLPVLGQIYLEGDLCAESLWGRALRNDTYKEMRETGLGRGRSWIKILLQQKILPIVPQAQEPDDPSELSWIEARGLGIDNHDILVESNYTMRRVLLLLFSFYIWEIRAQWD